MDWGSFVVRPRGTALPGMRSLRTREGVCDRLRSAAFAELQAREAFLHAARSHGEAPASLRRAWGALASAEDRHLRLLLRRLAELGGRPEERPVSSALWEALSAKEDGRSFALLMASAEERGRTAGERFCRLLAESDPATARLFGEIAAEEAAHIALARKHFPDPP